jgi:hypothetical protein
MNRRTATTFDAADLKRKAILIACVALIQIGSLSIAGAQDWEQPATRSAQDILSPEMLRGEHFAVADEVRTDGFVYIFDLTSDYGEMSAGSIWELQIRLGEIEALGELAKVSGSKAFAQTVGSSAMAPVDMAEDLVKSPGKTTKAMGKGVSNLFKKTKRQAKSVTATKEEPAQAETEGAEGEQEGEGEKSSNVDKALGTAKQERLWAYKLHVDPYSDNEILRAELGRVGKASAAAGGAVDLRAFDRVEGGGLPGVNQDVYVLAPPDLRFRNEGVLTQAGFTSETLDAYDAFFDNPVVSPTMRTIALDCFKALDGVEGREHLVSMIAAMETVDEARFQVSHAEFLAAYHEKTAPLARIYGGPALPGAVTTRGEVLIPFAADQLLWTEELAGGMQRHIESLREATGDETTNIYLAGDASAKAIEGMAGLGAAIHPMRIERR